MEEYNISKSKGKTRSNKYHNKTHKLYTRTKYHGDIYDEGDQFTQTHYGSRLESQKWDKMYPNLCKICFDNNCNHMIKTRLKLIWYAFHSENSLMSRLSKYIVRMIYEYTIDHSALRINKSVFSYNSFNVKACHSYSYGTPCVKRTPIQPSRKSKYKKNLYKEILNSE